MKLRKLLGSVGRGLHSALWFLNLLEPPVKGCAPMLSLSKLYMWLMLPLTAIAVLTPGNSDMVVALSGLALGVGNYAFRRLMQVKTRTGGYELAPEPPSDCNPTQQQEGTTPDEPRP